MTTVFGWIAIAASIPVWLYFFTRVWALFKFIRSGGSTQLKRTDSLGKRLWRVIAEVFGHSHFKGKPLVNAAHWLVMVGFLFGILVWFEAYIQTFAPNKGWPWLSHWPVYHFVEEVLGIATVLGIGFLIGVRLKLGDTERGSRFFNSQTASARWVEFIVFSEGLGMLLVKSTKIATYGGGSAWADFLSIHLAKLFPESPALVSFFALFKLLSGMLFIVFISRNFQWGVMWHRFTSFFNIFFQRNATGEKALQSLPTPDLEEDITPGSWKMLLDSTACTECGRCQSQCPAWNTEKPLSPKLLMMTLRDHSAAKAPFLQAAAAASGPVDEKGLPTVADHSGVDLLRTPLIGSTGYDIANPLTAYNPAGTTANGDAAGAIIDEDVLWSCTTCGACVEQCPVDIEHVDHIVDMRRYQTLIESAFPTELAGLFKNLENKSNPWGMSARARLEWAKGLPFDVKVIGSDVESADEVEWLFWVGCAGAYEDRAKKTTRAVAELLHTAGVDFAVLGDGESCTGDPARRAGNEILFQMLAGQNVATLNEAKAKKIVVTCAHCFNTIKNEYPQIGGEYEVVHHTQLLNRLVREKKLTPVAAPEEFAQQPKDKSGAASTGKSVTYHDPCYLGRHNQVYAPPRELIASLPGVEYKEMERSGEKSFCCGAGGARMWMEEKLGERINLNRTKEAVATGADRIAIGCPFCRVMMTDGLTAEQSDGNAREEVEVVDVANMLLAAVRRGEDTKTVDEGATQTV